MKILSAEIMCLSEQAIFLSSDAKIIIGNNVMFGPHVFIVTGDHRTDVLGNICLISK